MPRFIRKQLYGAELEQNFGKTYKEKVLSREELGAMRRIKSLEGKVFVAKETEQAPVKKTKEPPDIVEFLRSNVEGHYSVNNNCIFRREEPIPSAEQINAYREKLNSATGPKLVRCKIDLAIALAKTKEVENIKEAREILKGLVKEKDHYAYSAAANLGYIYSVGSVSLAEQIKDYREILSAAKGNLPTSYRINLASALANTKQAKNVEEAREILKQLIKEKYSYAYLATLDYIYRVGGSSVEDKISDYKEIITHSGVSRTYAKKLQKLQLHGPGLGIKF